MANSEGGVGELLTAARAGDCEALGQVLEACRGYLLLIARQELDVALQAKGGASDLVQESLLDAIRGFGGFNGTDPDELQAWLRRILLNNLVSFARRFRDAEKRRVGQEVPLPGSDSSAFGAGLVAPGSSPSHRAIAEEEAEAVRKRLQHLPEDYRQVLLLRYQEQLSFEDIGRRMALTPNAARKLWLRAVRRLKQQGDPPP